MTIVAVPCSLTGSPDSLIDIRISTDIDQLQAQFSKKQIDTGVSNIRGSTLHSILTRLDVRTTTFYIPHCARVKAANASFLHGERLAIARKTWQSEAAR